MLIRKNAYQRSFCKSVSYQKVKRCLERRCLKSNLSHPSRSIALLLSRLPPARCLSFSLSPSLFLTLSHSLSPTNTHTYTHNTPAHILRAPTKWSRKDHWSWLTISKSQLATCTEFPPNNDYTAQQTFENCFRKIVSGCRQLHNAIASTLRLNLIHKRTIVLPFENSWSWLKTFTQFFYQMSSAPQR